MLHEYIIIDYPAGLQCCMVQWPSGRGIFLITSLYNCETELWLYFSWLNRRLC